MRARLYELIWILGVTLLLICRATFGGEGWTVMAMVWAIIFLRAYGIVLQFGHYSYRIVSDRISTSTDGEYFATCPAIGLEEKTLMIKHRIGGTDAKPIYGEPVPTKWSTWTWPAVYIFELGTGRVGVAGKWGGKELGFLIVRQDLCEKLLPSGNWVIHAPTVTRRPVMMSLLTLLRIVRDTEPDKRYTMADQWWDILGSHQRFDAKKSPIHLCLDPRRPIISANFLGNPILLLPGKDEEPGKSPSFPPIEIPLQDIVGPEALVLDMRPAMQMAQNAELQKLRDDSTRDLRNERLRVQALEQALHSLTAIETGMSAQEMAKQQMFERVAGPEQTGEKTG
jgi:hypothetical protein